MAPPDMAELGGAWHQMKGGKGHHPILPLNNKDVCFCLIRSRSSYMHAMKGNKERKKEKRKRKNKS